MKECQHYIDLRNCLCEPVNIKGKQKGTIIRVHKPDGPSYLLQAIDKVLQANLLLSVLLYFIIFRVKC